MIPREHLQQAYVWACETELQAFKPGNVSVYADGHDMTVDDFRRSAAASAGPLTDPGLTLGEKIFYAVEASRTAVGCNTNLGIVLLCAPLLHACQNHMDAGGLRQALATVLANTTLADADWTFRAIVLANPGGLGAAPEQDVHSAPAVTLAEAMALAASRDRIALQYGNVFQDIFEYALPTYRQALPRHAPAWSALAVYAALFRRFPDSHVERKYGTRHHAWIAEKMARVAGALEQCTEPQAILDLLVATDREFKAKAINPGTMADFTVATLLAEALLGAFR